MRCCCDTFEITKGANIIAGLLTGGAVLQIILSCIHAESPGITAGAMIIMMVWSVLQLLVSILALIAVQKLRAVLIIPMLVYNVLAIVGTVILFFAFFAHFLVSGANTIAVFGLPVFCATTIGLQFWFFSVFRKFFNYLKEIESNTAVYGEF